jgi:5-(carboxyamino)imidazole ribonucleotide mutase
MKKDSTPIVAVIMGSDSDFPVMRQAIEILDEFKVLYVLRVISAHRTPVEMAEFAQQAQGNGLRVIIAGAGGAAHLPGMVAAHTILPVIGVPIPIGPLQGQDALYAIVQMPRGVPVATMAIGNAYNAGLMAVKILASAEGTSGEDLRERLRQYKERQRQESLAKVLKP